MVPTRVVRDFNMRAARKSMRSVQGLGNVVAGFGITLGVLTTSTLAHAADSCPAGYPIDCGDSSSICCPSGTRCAGQTSNTGIYCQAESGPRVTPEQDCPLEYPVRQCTNGANTSVESSLCCASRTVGCTLGGQCMAVQGDKIYSSGSSGTTSSGGSSSSSGTSTSGSSGTSGSGSGTSSSSSGSVSCDDDDETKACAIAVAPGARDAGGAAAPTGLRSASGEPR